MESCRRIAGASGGVPGRPSIVRTISSHASRARSVRPLLNRMSARKRCVVVAGVERETLSCEANGCLIVSERLGPPALTLEAPGVAAVDAPRGAEIDRVEGIRLGE